MPFLLADAEGVWNSSYSAVSMNASNVGTSTTPPIRSSTRTMADTNGFSPVDELAGAGKKSS
jgi:hypothetical protein